MNNEHERQRTIGPRDQRYENESFIERNMKRTEYAIKRFEDEGIRYIRPSEDSDRFIVYSQDNGRKYQFYAGTGLILGPYEDRGIENMIMIAKGQGAGK